MVAMTVEGALHVPPTAVTNAAAAANRLVGFLAAVFACRGFAPALAPLFREFDLGGVYHLGFLVAGLAHLAALARRLYRRWEPVTQFVTTAGVDGSGDAGPTTAPSRSE